MEIDKYLLINDKNIAVIVMFVKRGFIMGSGVQIGI